MVPLPILEREFRKATRRKRTYWVRMDAAVTAACFGVVVLVKSDSWATSAAVGRSLFQITSAVSFWSCLFAGAFTTSVCLSEERRQGTLRLLFLTPLRGYDVVTGKLANVSLNTVQTLMGVLPVMALSMVLGGVSLGEFWRMTVVLLNTLMFSLACGILAWLVTLICLGFAGRRISWMAAMSLSPALHALLKIAVGSAAAFRLSEARRNGELEFLLVTPLRSSRISRGHTLALRRQFALPFALVLVIDAGLLLLGGYLVEETADQSLFRCLWLWAMMVMLLVDAHALAWLGLWQGLRRKNQFVAIRRTLVRILVLPWLVFLATMCFGTLGGPLGPLIWWGVLGFGFDQYFYYRSNRNLRDLFRIMASEWFTLQQSGSPDKRWRPNLLGYDLIFQPKAY